MSTLNKIYDHLPFLTYLGDCGYVSACRLRKQAANLLRQADELEHQAILCWTTAEKEPSPCSSTASFASSSD